MSLGRLLGSVGAAQYRLPACALAKNLPEHVVSFTEEMNDFVRGFRKVTF
jgi:hypothetical protein